MPSVGAVTSGYNTIVVNAAYPNAKANDLILADAGTAPFTVTLPVGAQNNTQIAVKKTDLTSNLVTVAAGTGTTIDRDSSVGLYSTGAAVTLVYDSLNTTWRLISTGLTNLTGGSILPTGGAQNAVLTKISGSDYDVQWAAASSGGSAVWSWTSGRAYTSPFNPQSASTGNPFNNTYLNFMPVRVPNAVTISRLAIISYSGSATMYLGLYTDAGVVSTTGGPGTFICGGAFTSSPTGVFSGPAVNSTVSAGNYWIAYSQSGTGSTLSTLIGGPVQNVLLGASSLTSSVNANNSYLYDTAMGGGVAPTATVFSNRSLSPGGSSGSNLPMIYFVIA